MPLKFTLFGLEFAFLGLKFTLLLKFFIIILYSVLDKACVFYSFEALALLCFSLSMTLI